MADTSDNPEQVMPAQSDLVDEIEAAMTPWKIDEAKPPFSIAELVVMALVTEEELESGGVVLWLCTRSRYYQLLDFTSLAVSLGDDHADVRGVPGLDAREFRTGFHHSRLRHGVPVYGPWSGPYFTDNREARIFLADCLARSTKHMDKAIAMPRFPFFRLPAELRNTIYEMVFFVSPKGRKIKPDHSGEHTVTYLYRGEVGDVITRSDDCEDDMALSSWEKASLSHEMRNAGLLKDILIRTIVCRQWHQESIQASYTINTFFCWDVEHLRTFLLKVPKAHRDYIARLAFPYTGETYNASFKKFNYATSAFKLLAQLPKLQVLHLDACDSRVWQSGKQVLNAEGVIKRPGLTELMKVRVNGKVIFHDALESTKSVLQEALIVKPKKTIKKPVTKAKKTRSMPARGENVKSC